MMNKTNSHSDAKITSLIIPLFLHHSPIIPVGDPPFLLPGHASRDLPLKPSGHPFHSYSVLLPVSNHELVHPNICRICA